MIHSKQAIQITPYDHKINGLNVVSRRWDDSGYGIFFMLENRTFVHAKSDTEELDSEYIGKPKDVSQDLFEAWRKRDQIKMSIRPFRRPATLISKTSEGKIETP